MKAHISSSVNAHPLLHELERTAKELPDNYSRVEVPYHGGTTGIGELHISGPCEGEATSATIRQHSEKILVATLDNDSSLDPLTSKRRLGAFLGPLLKRYNETKKQNLAPDDQAVMIFEDDMQKV
jgi:hypothetical protein